MVSIPPAPEPGVPPAPELLAAPKLPGGLPEETDRRVRRILDITEGIDLDEPTLTVFFRSPKNTNAFNLLIHILKFVQKRSEPGSLTLSWSETMRYRIREAEAGVEYYKKIWKEFLPRFETILEEYGIQLKDSLMDEAEREETKATLDANMDALKSRVEGLVREHYPPSA